MEDSASINPPNNINLANAKKSVQASQSPLRQRPLGRASTFADTLSPLRQRRSSNFSDSIISSTDDLLLPRARSPGLEAQENSHWHSAPLALALLPAVGGLIFHNGGAVLTDVTLLGLAAVFLNWSVRLPWDWYYSTQSTLPEKSTELDEDYISRTIIEEGGEVEQNDNSHFPAMDRNNSKPNAEKNGAGRCRLQRDSAYELRVYELLALFSCFSFPIVGAWLLHTIRSQLSRPSEGLVSNYNLTIFLLASEVRPLSHLIKMVQARTLYLQRTLNNAIIDSTSSSSILDITSRLNDLEVHVAAAANPSSHSPSSTPTKLAADVRASLQPDIDALNRAVRRYEKRATLLTMQTESRLQDLEARMSDAITLAAAAERGIRSYSQNSERSSAFVLLDWLCATIVLPLQGAWVVASLPAKVGSIALEAAEGFVGRNVRREMGTAGRGSGGAERKGGGAGRAQGKGMKKAM